MRKMLGTLGSAAIIGFAVPASAHWQGAAIDPPGYPWAACSATYGCTGPLYTRRLIGHQRRVVVHHRHAHPVHRYPKRVVQRRWKLHHQPHTRYAIRDGFQYIDDPLLAAVLAWGDIVNSPPR